MAATRVWLQFLAPAFCCACCFSSVAARRGAEEQLRVAEADLEGPWIGVLGVPADEAGCDTVVRGALADPSSEGSSCFSSIYASFVQAAGARAVGIPYNALEANREVLEKLLESLDGVLFSGGGVNLSDTGSAYFRTGSFIFDWVKRTNDAGRYFPLRGHCMGFQFLSILGAGSDPAVLQSDAFDSEDLSLALEWAVEAPQSRWVSRMPSDVHEIFTKESCTSNLHHDGVSPHSFLTNPQLLSFYRVISTNEDKKGNAFVSTAEARGYPITAFQWHPERPQFDHSPGEGINHSSTAIRANAWVGADFLEEARRRQTEAGSRQRDLPLLRQFVTYGMRQTLAGDSLTGLSNLVFSGFPRLRPEIPGRGGSTDDAEQLTGAVLV